MKTTSMGHTIKIKIWAGILIATTLVTGGLWLMHGTNTSLFRGAIDCVENPDNPLCKGGDEEEKKKEVNKVDPSSCEAKKEENSCLQVAGCVWGLDKGGQGPSCIKQEDAAKDPVTDALRQQTIKTISEVKVQQKTAEDILSETTKKVTGISVGENPSVELAQKMQEVTAYLNETKDWKKKIDDIIATLPSEAQVNGANVEKLRSYNLVIPYNDFIASNTKTNNAADAAITLVNKKKDDFVGFDFGKIDFSCGGAHKDAISCNSSAFCTWDKDTCVNKVDAFKKFNKCSDYDGADNAPSMCQVSGLSCKWENNSCIERPKDPPQQNSPQQPAKAEEVDLEKILKEGADLARCSVAQVTTDLDRANAAKCKVYDAFKDGADEIISAQKALRELGALPGQEKISENLKVINSVFIKVFTTFAELRKLKNDTDDFMVSVFNWYSSGEEYAAKSGADSLETQNKPKAENLKTTISTGVQEIKTLIEAARKLLAAAPVVPPAPPAPAQCPPGTTGIHPDCKPVVVVDDKAKQSAPCPPGQTGTPPNCTPLAPNNNQPAVQTCEQRGMTTYTGPEKPGTRTPGMCINCSNEVYIKNGGSCEVAKTATASAPTPTQTKTTTPAKVAEVGSGQVNQAAQASSTTPKTTSYVAPASTNVAATNSLGGSARIYYVPERGKTGPGLLVYGVGFAGSSLVWLMRKRKKSRGR